MLRREWDFLSPPRARGRVFWLARIRHHSIRDPELDPRLVAMVDFSECKVGVGNNVGEIEHPLSLFTNINWVR